MIQSEVVYKICNTVRGFKHLKNSWIELYDDKGSVTFHLDELNQIVDFLNEYPKQMGMD